uniref:Uncharacterized protein n=1 Tax=Sphaerodactylus townsendi TaxID=933632 RepID=A0ACB8EL93_9SAUR
MGDLLVRIGNPIFPLEHPSHPFTNWLLEALVAPSSLACLYFCCFAAYRLSGSRICSSHSSLPLHPSPHSLAVLAPGSPSPTAHHANSPEEEGSGGTCFPPTQMAG